MLSQLAGQMWVQFTVHLMYGAERWQLNNALAACISAQDLLSQLT